MEPTTAETARWLRDRDAAARARASERAEGLRHLLPEAVAALRAFGARRIRLFGSLVSGDVHESSDVDLAVEGLSAERHQEALTALMVLFPCDVDLVRLEGAPEALRSRIAAEGRDL